MVPKANPACLSWPVNQAAAKGTNPNRTASTCMERCTMDDTHSHRAVPTRKYVCHLGTLPTCGEQRWLHNGPENEVVSDKDAAPSHHTCHCGSSLSCQPISPSASSKARSHLLCSLVWHKCGDPCSPNVVGTTVPIRPCLGHGSSCLNTIPEFPTAPMSRQRQPPTVPGPKPGHNAAASPDAP